MLVVVTRYVVAFFVANPFFARNALINVVVLWAVLAACFTVVLRNISATLYLVVFRAISAAFLFAVLWAIDTAPAVAVTRFVVTH